MNSQRSYKDGDVSLRINEPRLGVGLGLGEVYQSATAV